MTQLVFALHSSPYLATFDLPIYQRAISIASIWTGSIRILPKEIADNVTITRSASSYELAAGMRGLPALLLLLAAIAAAVRADLTQQGGRGYAGDVYSALHTWLGCRCLLRRCQNSGTSFSFSHIVTPGSIGGFTLLSHSHQSGCRLPLSCRDPSQQVILRCRESGRVPGSGVSRPSGGVSRR